MKLIEDTNKSPPVKPIPIHYTMDSFNINQIREDLLLLEPHNVLQMRITPSQGNDVTGFVESIRLLPQTLHHLEIIISPYQFTVDDAESMFKQLLFLPKSIRSLTFEMNFYNQNDCLSRFLIINLPKLHQYITTFKLSLNGCSNLLELSKKLNTIPSKLRAFKLRVYDIDLSTQSTEFLTANFERLPKTLESLSLSLESVTTLDAFTKAIPTLSSRITSFKLKAKSANFTDAEFAEFINQISKQFQQLNTLKLMLPENKNSLEILDILHKSSLLPERLTVFSLNLAQYNIWDGLKQHHQSIFDYKRITELKLNLVGCFNSNEDIIAFLKNIAIAAQHSLRIFSLTLSDDDITAEPLNFLLKNIQSFHGSLKKFTLRFIAPNFSVKDIKVPVEFMKSIPENIEDFVIRVPNFTLSTAVFVAVIDMYKQIGDLHARIKTFIFEFNVYRVNFEIKNTTQISFKSQMHNIIPEKHIISYNRSLQKLLFDTPPRFKLIAISITPPF